MKRKIYFYVTSFLLLLIIVFLGRYLANSQETNYVKDAQKTFYHFFIALEYFISNNSNDLDSMIEFINFLTIKKDDYYEIFIHNRETETIIKTDDNESNFKINTFELSIKPELDTPLNYFSFAYSVGEHKYIAVVKRVMISDYRMNIIFVSDHTPFFNSWEKFRFIWYCFCGICWLFISYAFYLLLFYRKKDLVHSDKLPNEALMFEKLMHNNNQSYLLLINSELEIEQINLRLANLLKYSPRNLVGKKISSIISNFDTTKVLNVFTNDFNQDDIDITIHDRAGNKHNFITSVIPFLDDQSNQTKAFIIFQDISPITTELNYLKAEIQKNSILNKFSQLVINVKDPREIIEIILEDSRSLIDYEFATMYSLNNGILSPYYTNCDEIKAVQDSFTFPVGRGITGLVARIKKSMMANDSKNNPFTQTVPDTEEQDESVLSSPVITSNDEVLGVITMTKTGNRNFTEMDLQTLDVIAKHSATVLEKTSLLNKIVDSEFKYYSLINQTALAMFILTDRKIVFCNNKFSEMLGIKIDNLLGQNIIDFIKEKDRSMFISNLTNFIIHEKSESFEFEFETYHKENLYLEFSFSNILWENNKSILATANNVTERVELNKKLQQSQKIESIGSLTPGIIHDFNNILSVILGAVDLMLMKTEADSPLYKLINIIKNSSNRAALLAQRLLNYSRKLEIEDQTFELNEFLQENIDFLSFNFDKSIQIEPHYSSTPLYFKGQQTKIHQCIHNLCVNARDAMPEGGKLIVRTMFLPTPSETQKLWPQAKNIPYSFIEVKDTGSGIPENIQDRIFENYFTTKEIGKGTGLGLSTTKKIINEYNGEILMKSVINEGTTFSIFLPWVEKVKEIINLNQPFTSSKQHKIILVDDEESILEIGKALLTELGHDVITFNNGFDAYNTIQEDAEISVAIIDRVMPNMDGLTLLKKIKEVRPKLPIVVASGFLIESMIKDIYAAGATDCLDKPFKLDEIKYILNKID